MHRDFKTELRSFERTANKNALLRNATAFMERLVKIRERIMSNFKQSAVQYAALSFI